MTGLRKKYRKRSRDFCGPGKLISASKKLGLVTLKVLEILFCSTKVMGVSRHAPLRLY
jgi:hypothetical protein